MPDAVGVGRYQRRNAACDPPLKPDALSSGHGPDHFGYAAKEILRNEIGNGLPFLWDQAQDQAHVFYSAALLLGFGAAGFDKLTLLPIERPLAHQFQEPENRVHGVAGIAMQNFQQALHVVNFHGNAPCSFTAARDPGLWSEGPRRTR